MPVVWDLCSGLGGWSEAFLLDGWTVIRIDNSDLVRHVPHTQDRDVLTWMDWSHTLPEPDLILASPPCLEFSNAYNAPRPTAKRAGEDFEPDMDIVIACKDIIDHHEPRWWAIENVAGSVNDIRRVLGKYRQIIGPFVLWGTIPYLPLPGEWQHHKKSQDTSSTDPLRANKKALIPFEISFSLLQSWKEQRTLRSWTP